MSRALSPSISRCYGLARVARVWKLSTRRHLSFSQRHAVGHDRVSLGPVGACSDAELAEHIRRQIINSGFHGEGHRKYGRGCASPRSREPSARAAGYGRARLARGASRRTGRGQGA